MKNFKKRIASLVMATSVIIPSVSAFAAVVTTPSGGNWDYGENSTIVWSNYQQYDLTHKSSVDGATFYSSVWKSPGTKAYASVASTIWADQAFYDEY